MPSNERIETDAMSAGCKFQAWVARAVHARR